MVSERRKLSLAVLATALAPVVLACGAAESADVPPEKPPPPPPAPVCTRGKCCPDIEWMLVSPARSNIGGEVELDVGVKSIVGGANTLKWTAEGGPVEDAHTAHARYTCVSPGLFRVRFRVANAFCETSQESHIHCVD